MSRRFAATLLLVLVLAGCGSQHSSLGTSEPQGNVQAGARLFVADRCVQCHMVNGVGGQVGPELTHNPTAADYESLRETLHHPPTTMMEFVKDLKLTDQQIADLSAFTDSSAQPRQ